MSGIQSIIDYLGKINAEQTDALSYAKKKARYDICLWLLKRSYFNLGISSKMPSDFALKDVAETIASNLKCPTERLPACFDEAIAQKVSMEYNTPVTFGDLDSRLKNGYVVRAQDIGDMSRFLPSVMENPELWRIPSVMNLAKIAEENGAIKIENRNGRISIGYQDTRQPSISYQQDGSTSSLLH